MMNNKNKTAAPALPVPTHLADYYPAALATVREKHNYGMDRSWDSGLSTRLWNVLAADLAARKHHGLTPGSIPRPLSLGMVSSSTASLTGRQQWGATEEDFSTVSQKQREAYEYSERHAVEFSAEVDALVSAEIDSPSRAWEAYLHVEAIELAAGQYDRRRAIDENGRRRRAAGECPICKDHETGIIGRVVMRRVLDGAEPGYNHDGAVTLRSCYLCWVYANDAYLAKHAATSAGESRAELAAAAMTAGEAK